MTHDHDAGHDITAKLAKVLVLLDEPITMKRTLVTDPELPSLALRLNGEVHTIPGNASEAELLELLDDPLKT